MGKDKQIRLFISGIILAGLFIACTMSGDLDDLKNEAVPPHEHTWGEWIVTQAATCSAAGVETRLCADDDTHKDTRPVAIDADAHKWGMVEPGGIEPTCTSEGFGTRICTLNEEHIQEDSVLPVDPANHVFEDWEVTVPAGKADGIETEKCSLCGALGTITRILPALASLQFTGGDLTANSGFQFTYILPEATVAGDSVEGVSYTVNELPIWLNFYTSTRKLDGTWNGTGEWTFTVTASKEGYNSATATFFIRVNLSTPVSGGAILGITPPVYRGTPALPLIDTAQYNGIVIWSGKMDQDNKFSHSTEYTASILITAKNGFTLKGVAADAFTVKGGLTPAVFNASTGYVTVTFPATASHILVSNYDELDNIRNDLGARYKLTNDIEIPPPSPFPKNWDAIGMVSGTPFYGTLDGTTPDGKAYKIKNLYMNKGFGLDYVGFFGYLQNATVTNIGIETVNWEYTGYDGYAIKGLRCVGGIAGYAFNSTIENCSVVYVGNGGLSSQTNTTEKPRLGGIVGYSFRSKVFNCYTAGTIRAILGASAGGIVGFSESSEICNCYSTVSIITGDTAGLYTGGIAGHTYNGSISKCYATGNISGAIAGGIAGVNGVIDLPGGYAPGNTVISECAAINSAINGLENAGRITGLIVPGSTNTNNFALDTMTVNGGTATDSAINGIGKTVNDFTVDANLWSSAPDGNGLGGLGFDTITIWQKSFNQLPNLRWQ